MPDQVKIFAGKGQLRGGKVGTPEVFYTNLGGIELKIAKKCLSFLKKTTLQIYGLKGKANF